VSVNVFKTVLVLVRLQCFTNDEWPKLETCICCCS